MSKIEKISVFLRCLSYLDYIDFQHLIFFYFNKFKKFVGHKIEYETHISSFSNNFEDKTEQEIINMFEHNLKSKFFISDEKEMLIKIYKNSSILDNKKIMQKADRIVDNKYKLLGSDEYKFNDNINWHLDFVNNFEFNQNLIFLDTENHLYPKDKKKDIKIPWELNRFKHFIDIGVAYALTSDEKYSKSFISNYESWTLQNRIGYGINWMCPMEVSLRSINWLWGYFFFKDSNNFTSENKIKFISLLYNHGKFIYNNLEYGVTRANHYLADITGLYILSFILPETEETVLWRKRCKVSIKQEMHYQVKKDGVHFEASIGYHKLVLEMFTLSYIISTKNNESLGNEFVHKLRKMYDFLNYSIAPDSILYQIGDCDDGKIIDFSSPNHNLTLLAIGAILFKSNKLRDKAIYGNEAFWLLGIDGKRVFSKLNKDITFKSQSFENGGYYFVNSKNFNTAIRLGLGSVHGYGVHSHNDSLSFELFFNDIKFITDSGTYIYTGSEKWRNHFRSSYAHNTVIVDDNEINSFKEKSFSSFKLDSHPHLLNWKVTDREIVFDGLHTGYQRLNDPVIHRRKITFYPLENLWKIKEFFYGTGKHKIDILIHTMPGIIIDILNYKALKMSSLNDSLMLRFSPDLKIRLSDSHYSPSYNVIQKNKRICLTAEIDLDAGIKLINYEIAPL